MPEEGKTITVKIPDPWKLLLVIFCAISLINLYYVFNLYQRFTGLAALPSVEKDQGTDQQPQQQEAEQDPFSLLSAQARELNQRYGVQGTPTVVINCEYRRVGSMSIAESQGSIPAGSELQDFVNAFCQVAGENSVFCKDKKELAANNKIELEQTNQADCGATGKVKLYVFHSPTCPFCEQQAPILNTLKQKYGDAVEVNYVCTPIHGVDDVRLCKEQSSTYNII